MKTLLALLMMTGAACADDSIVQSLYPLNVLDASWDGNSFYLVVRDNGSDRTGLANTVCRIIEHQGERKFAMVRVMDGDAEYRVLGKARCSL